jgi:UDP-N-acetylglucosamine transferase subunit ALG13
MIYVSVGTMFLDFPRLILKMDEIAATTGERVVIQTGMGDTIPVHCEYFDFRPREEVLSLQREARAVVCHAGIGTVSEVLTAKRPLIVVPRLKRYNEHMNDHQLDLAGAVERRGWGRMILDVADLESACAAPPPAYSGYTPARSQLVDAVRTLVNDVARRKAERTRR